MHFAQSNVFFRTSEDIACSLDASQMVRGIRGALTLNFRCIFQPGLTPFHEYPWYLP